MTSVTEQATADRFAVARSVADAVLYEGYVLYPYRASAPKNQVRFQWGVLVPKAFSEADGSERWSTRTECLVDRGDGRSEQPGAGSGHVVLRVRMRCLQTQRRSVEALVRGTAAEPSFVRVAGLEVDGTAHVPWDEALDQSVDLPPLLLRSAEPVTVHQAFTFGGGSGDRTARRRGRHAGRAAGAGAPAGRRRGPGRRRADDRQRPVREGVRDGREHHRVGPRRQSPPRDARRPWPGAWWPCTPCWPSRGRASSRCSTRPTTLRTPRRGAAVTAPTPSSWATSRSCSRRRSSSTTTPRWHPRARATSTTRWRSTKSWRCAS